MALLARVQPEAVVASAAGSATGVVAEISKHKGSAATGGVRVLLHGVELCEIGAPTTIERGPLDVERGQRHSGVRQPGPASQSLPRQELSGLKRREDRDCRR
jgi:hypothetical protein